MSQDQPPVPTRPEPLEALQARYSQALATLFDVEAIQAGAIRPGEIAANVFDFDDGLRLIVSRERRPDGKVQLHVSASFPAQCRIADEFRLLASFTPEERLLAKWVSHLPQRFQELSGEVRPLRYIGLSDSMIPHFVIEEDA